MNSCDKIKKVTIVGLICNILLVVVKIIFALASNSKAMFADAIHSIEDSFASILSYIGVSVSKRYNNKIVQYIFSLLISIFIILSAIIMLKSIYNSIYFYSYLKYSTSLVIVCLINILIKLLLFLYTKKKYNNICNILLKAIMIDHRNDMFLTLSTLLSVICAYFRIYVMDIIIGGMISIFILYTGISLLIECLTLIKNDSIDNN